MGRITLLFVAAFAVAAVVSEDSTATDNLAEMSKEQLIHALTKSRNSVRKAEDKLDTAHERIKELKTQLEEATGEKTFSEKQREAHERKVKDDAKKAEQAKRAARLKQKAKMSDVLMEHGSEYLAMKTAKALSDKDGATQEAAVLKAARKGARAGAVGPLKKVVRAAAVAAVKKARKEALKKKITGKSEIRKITSEAAKKAVNKILADQDKMVEKTAQKFLKAAQDKYPAALELADEDDDTPNDFTAPPSIHLSLTDDDTNAAKEVEQLKEASSTDEKEEEKSAEPVKEAKTNAPQKKEESTPAVATPSSKATKSTKVVPVTKAHSATKVAKAATAAKQAAGKIVPEKH